LAPAGAAVPRPSAVAPCGCLRRVGTGRDDEQPELVVALQWHPALRRRGGQQDIVPALGPGLAASTQVLERRRHLFEEFDITLDHPGVTMTKPLGRQYQAMVEVVAEDRDAFERLTASEPDAGRRLAGVHAARRDGPPLISPSFLPARLPI
jgi:hypothetical protein